MTAPTLPHWLPRFDGLGNWSLRAGQPGDAQSFLPLLRRLQAGKPLNVLAIGSSATGVNGGCTHPAPLVNASGRCRCPHCCGPRCGYVRAIPTSSAAPPPHQTPLTTPSAMHARLSASQQFHNRGWARSTLSMLNRLWPHPEHRLFNLGEPGGTLIPALATCPQTYLHQIGAIHLVLVDPLTTPDELAVERLLRMLLRGTPASDASTATGAGTRTGTGTGTGAGAGTGAPIVMLVGFLPFLRSGRCQHGQLTPGAQSIAAMMMAAGRAKRHPSPGPVAGASLLGEAIALLQGEGGNAFGGTLLFFRRAQRHEALWRYYGQPSVQLFDALALEFERHAVGAASRADGTALCTPPCAPCAHPPCRALSGVSLCAWTSDGTHPDGPAASRTIAELLTSRLYDGLGRAARTPRPLYDARVTTNDDARSERRGRRALASWRHAHNVAGRTAPLPPPLYLPRCEQRVGMLCFSFDRDGWEAASTARPTSQAALRWQSNLSRGLGLAGVPSLSVLHTGVLPRVERADGWRFVELEATSRTPYKPGIVADRPGALLVLRISLSRARKPWLQLQYLAAAHRRMGTVRLSCARWCWCDAITIDAARADGRASLLMQAQLALRLSADAHRRDPGKSSDGPERRSRRGAVECTLQFIVLNATRSRGHRFKLSRLMVEEEVAPPRECGTSVHDRA